VAVALLAWGPLMQGPAARSANDTDAHHFLRSVGGFTPEEIAALERGEPLARVLATDRRQVAVVGGIRVHAPRERLLSRYRDVKSLERSKIVQAVGVFSQPPRPDDLRELPFEDYDLGSVRECKLGDCTVRLPAATMSRFQQEVDWSNRAWRQQSAAIWRDVLAGVAGSYLTGGDRLLLEFNNKEEPLRVADELGTLYEDSRDIERITPVFFRYVREFPRAPLGGTENIFYWSKEEFGLRPIVSITHLAIYDPPARPLRGASAFVATKQIYAMHYFDAALGFTIVASDDNGGFYMVTINRARTRSLTSRFRGLVRSRVQARSRDALEKILRATKQNLEAAR
jgi:hypothetical protein